MENCGYMKFAIVKTIDCRVNAVFYCLKIGNDTSRKKIILSGEDISTVKKFGPKSILFFFLTEKKIFCNC
jgi:hypothetical protein